MYLICDQNNLIHETCNYPAYVLKQTNGVIVLCEKENADWIYSNDTDSFYVVPKDYYQPETFYLVEVESAPEDINEKDYKYENGEFVVAPPVITNNDLLSRIENVENGLLDLMEGQVDTFELILGGM